MGLIMYIGSYNVYLHDTGISYIYCIYISQTLNSDFHPMFIRASMNLSEGYMFDPCPGINSKHFSKDLSLTIVQASTFTASVYMI